VGKSRADHDHDVWGRGRLRAAMMQGCHPLSEHRNAVGGVAVQRFRAGGSELEKRSLRLRGSRSLNWTFTHERLRMFHQQRRRGTPIRAIFSIPNLVLNHAPSPAFDVAKDVPPRKVRAALTKVITMIVAPLGNGPIDVRDRALILIGSPAHCHTANWSPVTSARRPPTGGYPESGDESDEETRK
jgi:hypothetical protein